MDFRWIDWNIRKVEGHGVTPDEVEEVVRAAKPPYPEVRSDEKYVVWGRTAAGRLLQVVFLLDSNGTLFVIHSRPLTEAEKGRWRRSQRRRQQR